MASINEMIAAEINSCIEKAARRIYNKNVKLSPEEVANLIERHLFILINEKTIVSGMPNKTVTLAKRLVKDAVAEIDKVK